MKASFVIATYNRATDLERCLDSILRQQNLEFEILVIDDASTDQTCSLIREKYYGQVKLITREVNCGSIPNRNYGAGLAQGEILFLIDDDTELPGECTAKEVVLEFADSRVGAVAIPYIQDGKLKQSGFTSASGERDFVVASYIGCACAIRGETFLELGGYEEFFHHQVEEDDFSIRMLNTGKVCRVARIREPMIHYESPVRNVQKWDYYGRRNSLLYVWKNCPLLYLFPNLFITTLRGVIHAFRIRRFRGNFTGLYHGYVSILMSLCGRGCQRDPVRKEVYKITRKLRKKPMLMASLEASVIESKLQPS